MARCHVIAGMSLVLTPLGDGKVRITFAEVPEGATKASTPLDLPSDGTKRYDQHGAMWCSWIYDVQSPATTICEAIKMLQSLGSTDGDFEAVLKALRSAASLTLAGIFATASAMERIAEMLRRQGRHAVPPVPPSRRASDEALPLPRTTDRKDPRG